MGDGSMGVSRPRMAGFIAGVDLAARVGVGLDGVMRDSGDGLTFLSVGLRGDISSTNSVSGIDSSKAGGNPTSAIPSRTGRISG